MTEALIGGVTMVLVALFAMSMATDIELSDTHDSLYLHLNNLIMTKARSQFESTQDFLDATRSFHRNVMNTELNEEYEKSHPFIVRVSEGCDHLCHSSIQSHFHKGHYSIIDSSYGLVSATPIAMEAYAAKNPSVLAQFAPIPPDVKIESDVNDICGFYTDSFMSPTFRKEQTHKDFMDKFSNNNKMKNRHENNIRGSNTRTDTLQAVRDFSIEDKKAPRVKLRLNLSPLSSDELEEFKDFAYSTAHKTVKLSRAHSESNSNKDSDSNGSTRTKFDMNFEYGEGQRHEEDNTYAFVTIDGSCSAQRPVERSPYEVAQLFAGRREVLSIEIEHDVVLFNAWSNGVCDTGNHLYHPLDFNNITGEGQVVGVVDTGIDMKSCYFRDPSCETPYSIDGSVINTNCRKVIQYINFTDKTDWLDGHGTHVAGSVGGRSILDYGDYARYNGNAADVKIAFFDIGSSESQPNGDVKLKLPTNYNTGMFQLIYKSGARVITNSWGNRANTYDKSAEKCDEFMWEHPEALLIFAAGNDGCLNDCANSVSSPGTAKNVLTVGATLNSHQSWQAYSIPDVSELYSPSTVAGFSSRGPTSDGRLKPDVLAPGWWVTSARADAGSTSESCHVSALRGTSMSAPVSAAFAVKVRSYFTQGYYPSGVKTPGDAFVPAGSLLKAMLVHSAQRMEYIMNNTAAGTKDTTVWKYVEDTITGYPSAIQGHGRVQMDKVLNFVEERSQTAGRLSLFVVGDVDVGSPNYRAITNVAQIDKRTLRTTKTNIRVTLVYTDKAGAPQASNVMINQLGVDVFNTRTGQTFVPYAQNNGVVSNVQMIDISSESVNDGDEIILSVRASTLVASPQPYALVVTGESNIEYLPDNAVPEPFYVTNKPDYFIDHATAVVIAILSLVAVIVILLVLYIRRLTTRNTSIILDPKSFESWDENAQVVRDPHVVEGMLSRQRMAKINRNKKAAQSKASKNVSNRA